MVLLVCWGWLPVRLGVWEADEAIQGEDWSDCSSWAVGGWRRPCVDWVESVEPALHATCHRVTSATDSHQDRLRWRRHLLPREIIHCLFTITLLRIESSVSWCTVAAFMPDASTANVRYSNDPLTCSWSSRMEEASGRELGVSDLSFFDSVAWVTGRAYGL